MALTINSSGGGRTTSFYSNPTATTTSHRVVFLPLTSSSSRTRHVAVGAKKLSSRSGRSSESKNSRTSVKESEFRRTGEIIGGENGGVLDDDLEVDDGFVMPELPGDKPDWFEGEQWDALGFVVQYLWAFGIVFALVACGIAVATYNEGATDFKDTPAYKESIGSQEALEEPESSNSEVFESNPTEVAPSLE